MHRALKLLLLPTVLVAVVYALTGNRSPGLPPMPWQFPGKRLITNPRAETTALPEDVPTYYFQLGNRPGVRHRYEQIASEIASDLKDAGICGFELEISVTRDAITLDGTVASPEQSVAAGRLSASVGGQSMRVVNRLRIAKKDE